MLYNTLVSCAMLTVSVPVMIRIGFMIKVMF